MRSIVSHALPMLALAASRAGSPPTPLSLRGPPRRSHSPPLPARADRSPSRRPPLGSVAVLAVLVLLAGCVACLAAKAQDGALDMPLAHPSAYEPDVVEDGPSCLIYDEELPTRRDSVVYVLDISGSMQLDPSVCADYVTGVLYWGGRLERAKLELAQSIQALAPSMRFNVLAYDCLISRWSPERRAADAAAKASAVRWVLALEPQGGTATGPAVALALAEKDNLTVVLLSDGAPGCGAPGIAAHLRMIQATNTQGARIHCFGIACHDEFEAFMRAVAATSGGRYIAVP